MRQDKRLTINSICNVGVFALAVIGNFVLTPFILEHLGQSTYGIWALTGSLLAYSTLISTGLNSAVNRWVPMYMVKRDYTAINHVVNTTLVCYLIAAGIVGVLVALLSIRFPIWFDIAPGMHTASRLTVLIVGAGFVVLVGLNVFAAVLSSLQRYDLMAASDMAGDLGRVAGIIAILCSGFGLVAFAAVSAAANGVRVLLKTVFALRKFPQLQIRLSLARWAVLWEMFGYSVNTLMYSCGQIIQRKAALILIGAVMGTAAVTEYAIPSVVMAIVGQLVMAGAAVMKPAATKLDTERRTTLVQELYLKGTKYALMIVLPIVGFIQVYGDALMKTWLRDGYVPSMSVILCVASVSVGLCSWHTPGFYVVVGMGKHRVFGVATLLGAVFSVLFGLGLALWTSWGVVGVAIGFAISESLVALLIITPYCCRSVGIRLREELARCLWPAVCATLPFAVLLGVARSIYVPVTIGGMMLLVALLTVPILVGWWLWGFSSNEKARFAAMLPLGRLRARAGPQS